MWKPFTYILPHYIPSEYKFQKWTAKTRSARAGRSEFLAKTRILSLRPFVQLGSGTHPGAYPMGTEALIPVVTRPEREADHSLQYSDEVNNAWSFASVFPILFNGLVVVVFHHEIRPMWPVSVSIWTPSKRRLRRLPRRLLPRGWYFINVFGNLELFMQWTCFTQLRLYFVIVSRMDVVLSSCKMSSFFFNGLVLRYSMAQRVFYPVSFKIGTRHFR
jgi:hypothetical protein